MTITRRTAIVAGVDLGLLGAVQAANVPPQAPFMPPPPEATPTLSLAPQVSVRPILDKSRVLVFSDYYGSNSLYDRFQRLTCWKGTTGSLTIRRKNLSQVTTTDFTPARTYTLMIDGKAWRPVPFSSGQDSATITFPLDDIAGGWHELDLQGCEDGETCINWFAYRQAQTSVRSPRMPVVQGSHALSWLKTNPVHAWAWVPCHYTPRSAPLGRRTYPSVAASTSVAAQVLVQGDGGQDLTYPNVNSDGVWSTHGKQSYFWSDVIAKLPVLPLLDGPRGRCTAGMVLHIEVGTAAPDGVPRNNVYCLDPWRVFKIAEDGHITTLVGYRHAKVMSHWQDATGSPPRPRTLELVGDWSAVDPSRRGFHELWGMCWDSQTLAINEAADRIPSENQQRPHYVAPVMFVTDSQNNRICRIEFNATAHGVPPKVSEFIVGLRDPWDVVEWGRTIIVSERQAHRIVAFDIQSGQQTRVIVERDSRRPGDASVLSWLRNMSVRVGTTAELRAQPCIAPEGLYVQDDWLYYGSFAAACIKRVHLITGEIQYVQDVTLVRQSNFVKFALSDGTFGPRGTAFVNTWGQQPSAAFEGRQPDGKRFTAHARAAPWEAGIGYAAGIGVGGGRLYFSASNQGVTRYSAGQAIDVRKYEAGKAEFDASQGRLRWGPLGFSHYGHPLPWGQSEALDYYLDAHDLR